MKQEQRELIRVAYVQDNILNSWTWSKLTEEERTRFLKLINIVSLVGYNNRGMIEEKLNAYYLGFLIGLNYPNERWVY